MKISIKRSWNPDTVTIFIDGQKLVTMTIAQWSELIAHHSVIVDNG
jgi:hypothetical protein